ncbi:hypothetical protein M8C21_002134, partial [Ambrosia artemisiifolia]
MENEVVKRRGRKRKRKGGEEAKKAVVVGKAVVLIGRYVKKEFEESGEFLGKIVSYDKGLYRVNYEDGDFEDLETKEVKGLLVQDSEMDAAFRKRKKSLDAYLAKRAKKEKESAVVKSDVSDKKVETVGSDNGVELANGEKVEGDVESSSDLSDCDQLVDVVEVERPCVPPPQLPPSSGNFGVREEDVSYLLSVYSFLRSFSVCLFLSPFGLDEFVGALNSTVHNTLLDAIHVALIRALKSYVETLSSEGSELAQKCLRSMDWSLLDSLTWPVFVVQYLTTMRYAEGKEWKDFYVTVLEKDYYTLSAGRKLTVLQLLCDDASNSAELMAEIDNREESEFGPDPDRVVDRVADRVVVSNENIPRRGRPRKNPLPKDEEAVKDVSESHTSATSVTPSPLVSKTTGSSNNGDDDDDDGIMKMFIPEGDWFCPECTINKIGPIVTKKTSLKGAEFFGIDPYEQVFLGSCDHLLVMKASTGSGSHLRYYSPADIPKVLHALTCSVEHTSLYMEICKGILQHWEIPESIFSLPDSVEIDNNTGNAPDVIDAGNINGVADNDSKKDSLIACEDKCKSFVAPAPATFISENGNSHYKSGSTNITYNLPNLLFQKKEANLAKSYMGLSFKPQAYLNVYIHGDFAASAGASLAILSAEEKMDTQTQSSISNHRKFMTANYSLQAKAFSLAAKRFYWPNYEKKLVEVSRERCGWCLSCKAVVNSKRGCLLNAAASNAIKGAAKILSSSRQSKNVEGSLAAIATYVIFMEESLYGLTVGPFLNSSFRNQWQKHVEEAATLSEIKAYLLELERNIRDIAFSSDWIRHIDDTSSESQPSQSAKSMVGSAKKRGPGKPGRKPAIVIPEIPDADVKVLSTDFTWWRGGMLSKHIFQKGILPQVMIKHAARKGGREKINGVQYVDGLEVPTRSRQFIWRAAVDLSQTASQLALQIRYLDFHVRWNELVCPEQPLQDGKGLEAEASAFRNACIIDKKIIGNKLSYGVVFENQKHIPSRVLKKVLEVEETGDKKSKNWFLEMHIPLYLIKEYETVVAADVRLPAPDIKHVTKSSKLTKKQLKASGKNIFSFLEQKRDNTGKCFCTFCQRDIFFRIAARCRACQGYCHEQCAVGTNIQTAARVEFLITCKRCYIEKDVTPKKEIVGYSPTSPLLLRGQERQHSTSLIKVVKQNIHERPLQYSNPISIQPKKGTSGKKNSKNRPLQSVDQKPKVLNSSKSSKKKDSKNSKLCLGLIWKRRNLSDTGIEFRINNILLKGNPNGHLLAPKCQLCAQPYNPELMYILCEKCKNWFHADSVNLQESKIMELFGYKCCRCRRIRIPICPYTDPETRAKLEAKKDAMAKVQRQKNLESDSDLDSDSETNDELIKEDWDLDSTQLFDSEEAVNVEDENPFYSFQTVDQVNDDKLEADSGLGPNGPKKLPVRRLIKPENESDVGFEVPAAYSGINNPNPTVGESSTPTVEWDAPTNGVADDMMFDYGDLNYEDMEFEPQTYFSFNELLASDDSVPPPDGGGSRDPPGDVNGPSTDDYNAEQYQMGITDDQQEPMFSVESGLEMVPCK